MTTAPTSTALPTYPPLPPVLKIPSVSERAAATATERDARPIKPFPLTPSDWWDDCPTKRVEFQFETPRAPLYRAAVQVGLKCTARGRHLFAEGTLEEIVKAIQWAWDEKREAGR